MARVRYMDRALGYCKTCLSCHHDTSVLNTSNPLYSFIYSYSVLKLCTLYKLSIYFQGELQFYDTPRNLLNDIPTAPVPDSYGNYDTPQQPLPVYRKPCGCIMKLVKLNGKYQSAIK